jgi:hypothetical protein
MHLADEDKQGLPAWTPAPNPWRALRRGVAGVALIGGLAWAAWAIVKHPPTITFTLPNLAHGERGAPSKSLEIATQRPAMQGPNSPSKTPVKPGPVVRDVTDQ